MFPWPRRSRAFVIAFRLRSEPGVKYLRRLVADEIWADTTDIRLAYSWRCEKIAFGESLAVVARNMKIYLAMTVKVNRKHANNEERYNE